MENEKINNENYLTKKEIITEIDERLKQNEEDLKQLLLNVAVKDIDELLEKNALNNEFEEELSEFNDIQNDNEFLISVLNLLKPKEKKPRKNKKNATEPTTQ